MNNVIFSNSVIACRDRKIITPERIKRMINADTYSDSVKVLFECGYDNEKLLSPTSSDSDVIVQDELGKTIADLKRYCGDVGLLHLLLTRYDYHNAKVIYKNHSLKSETTESVFAFGNIFEGKLRDAVINENYRDLPKQMGDAFTALNKLDNPSGAQIDLTLEKAMYADIINQLNKIKNKTIKNYFTAEVDMINITTFAKCRMDKISVEELNNYFISGGNLTRKELDPIYNSSIKNYIGVVSNSKYRGLIKALQECFELNDIGIFESYASNYLVEVAQEEKENIFSVALVFAWFILKLEELKIVKIILLGRQLDYSKRQFRDALKGIYERFR